MLSWRTVSLHLLILALFSPVVVAGILPLNMAALAAWAVLVRTWARRSGDIRGRGGVLILIQAAGMFAIVLAASFAPVKTVDRLRARHILLTKPVMTLAELADPIEHGWRPSIYCYVSVPEGMGDRAVRFPSRDVTVGSFIDAIESQTPLRHRFGHCGNGYTVLWGGDCSFGLRLRIPPH